jgi:hypothetical protein
VVWRDEIHARRLIELASVNDCAREAAAARRPTSRATQRTVVVRMIKGGSFARRGLRTSAASTRVSMRLQDCKVRAASDERRAGPSVSDRAEPGGPDLALYRVSSVEGPSRPWLDGRFEMEG